MEPQACPATARAVGACEPQEARTPGATRAAAGRGDEVPGAGGRGALGGRMRCLGQGDEMPGPGGGAARRNQRGWDYGSLRGRQKAPISPRTASLTPELNNVTKPTNKEEQLISNFINNY